MFVLMQCHHHAGMDAARDEHRPAHRAWVGSGGNGLVGVLIGSAMVDENGASIGNWGVLDAASLDDAHAFAEGDAFYKEGIVREIVLTALPDTFQADRITNPMSKRG